MSQEAGAGARRAPLLIRHHSPVSRGAQGRWASLLELSCWQAVRPQSCLPGAIAAVCTCPALPLPTGSLLPRARRDTHCAAAIVTDVRHVGCQLKPSRSVLEHSGRCSCRRLLGTGWGTIGRGLWCLWQSPWPSLQPRGDEGRGGAGLKEEPTAISRSAASTTMARGRGNPAAYTVPTRGTAGPGPAPQSPQGPDTNAQRKPGSRLWPKACL